MIANKGICYFILMMCFAFLMQNKLLYAQDIDSVLFTNDFFDNDSALQLTLKFDIKKFTKEKMEEEYLPATLSYFIDDTIEIKKQVRIKSRGEIRKNYCSFPPFFINIRKAELPENLLSDINKVKVVNRCMNTKNYNGLLLKEYLAYKIFNIITEYSFKVRLLDIKYIDTGRKDKTYNQFAFMIEPEKLLAERLNSYPLDMDYFNYSQMDTMFTTTMSIFQYMIGNTDFSAAGRHNLKLIIPKDYTRQALIPIPYDFDYAGIVNAPYAMPQKGLPISSVTERCFWGMCRPDEVYITVLDLYLEKKEEIETLLRTFEYIDEKTRRYVLDYVEEFYKEIKKPNFIKKRLRITCDN